MGSSRMPISLRSSLASTKTVPKGNYLALCTNLYVSFYRLQNASYRVIDFETSCSYTSYYDGHARLSYN